MMGNDPLAPAVWVAVFLGLCGAVFGLLMLLGSVGFFQHGRGICAQLCG